MKTSLVTTCWNERNTVEQWLGDVLNQSHAPDEVIIVDNFSSDGTYEYLLDQADKVRVMQLRCSVAQGRNQAIRQATNEIIVSTDMGTRLHQTWLEFLVKPFVDDPSIDVVAGNYEHVYPIKNSMSRADFYYRNPCRTRLVPGFLPSSRNIAYKQSVWEKIGGYQEGLKNATDDTIFAHEIHHHGFKMALAPDSLVFWNRHETLDGYLKETARYAYGNGEARIRRPFLTCHVSSAMYPWWKACYASYALLRSGKAILRALKAHDPIMLVCLPHFVAMNALVFAEFYRKGYQQEGDGLPGLRKRIQQLGLS
jgi:cellulose synthase/poly-beta-1,6-N-acetylglucosamine synthase-like glycosyltransferase